MLDDVANDAEAPARATHPPLVVRAGLTPSAAVILVAAVVVAYTLANAFELAHRTVGWVIACSIVALLIDPVVDFVARVLPRWLAVVVVLLAVIAIITLVIVSLAHDLMVSLDDLKANAPDAARSLERRYDWAADIRLGSRVEDFVGELDSRVRRDTVTKALGTAPSYVVTGVLMLFLLIYGRRYFDGFVRQFGSPRREHIRSIGHDAARRGRRYLLIVVAESILNGVAVGALCAAFDLPAEVSLGFAVAALTVLPLFGVLVGGIPALLLSFGLLPWWQATLVLLLLLVLQGIEIGLVRPYVDAKTVRVGPTVPIVVGLLGFELYGPGGAVYGIALAVIALAALDGVGRMRDEPAT